MSLTGDIDHSLKYVDIDRLFSPYAVVRTQGCSLKSVVSGEPWCVSYVIIVCPTPIMNAIPGGVGYEGRMKMTGGYSVEEISLHDDGVKCC